MESIRDLDDIKVEIPKKEEKREIEYLYIEADEDHVSLQEGGTISPELIYIHEGFEEVEGKDNRRKLKNVFYISGNYKGTEEIWNEAYEYISKKMRKFRQKEEQFKMHYLIFLLFILGLVMITKGGDWFVDAAAWVAEKFGVPQIIIGATIVSLGTTLPEVAASVNASLRGESKFALGNAIGSIDVNTGFILGLLILLSNIRIPNRKLFLMRGGFLTGFILLLYVLSAMDHVIGRLDGVILFILLLVYIGISIHEGKRERNNNNKGKEQETSDIKEILKNIFLLIVGAVMVAVGADLLVENGIKIAEIIGVPNYIVSLTMVAVGTSLPELVTSIIAIVKKYYNLSVGNVLGANIMNIGLVISLSSMINPIKITNQMLSFDFLITLVFIVVSVLFGLIYKGYKKYNGLVLIGLYLFYVVRLYS